MRTRLFHTVVLVGTAMGASLSVVSCGGSESGSDSCQGNACDTFPGISYVGDSGKWDTIANDTDHPEVRETDSGSGDGGWDTIADTWPGIHPADSGAKLDTAPDGESDTFPGITPVLDSGTDTWPGISPPPDPDAHA